MHSGWLRTATVITLVGLGSGVAAQEITLQNDNVQPGLVPIELGFVNGEIGAATFIMKPEWFPVRIKKVQIMWAAATSAPTNNIQDAILIYTGVPSQVSLIFESDPIQLSPGFINEFDFSNENIEIQNPVQAITVGMRFSDAPNGDPNKASLAKDQDGCQTGLNYVHSVGGCGVGWINACNVCGLPATGDWVIRAVIEPIPCYPDCDGNATLDLFDFLCFTNAFNSQDPYADCDGSGGLDLFDFLCFTNGFNAGCP